MASEVSVKSVSFSAQKVTDQSLYPISGLGKAPERCGTHLNSGEQDEENWK